MINSRCNVHNLQSFKAKAIHHNGINWLDLTVTHDHDIVELTLFPSADLPVWKMQLIAAKINEVMEMKSMGESNTPQPPEGISTPGEAARPIDPREINAENTPDPGTVPAIEEPYPTPDLPQGNNDG